MKDTICIKLPKPLSLFYRDRARKSISTLSAILRDILLKEALKSDPDLIDRIIENKEGV